MIPYGEIVLIEDDGYPTRWSVSFQGSNPPPEKCVQCASKEDALRLIALLAHGVEAAI